ncbi:MAG: hypothetical protein IH616_08185 [Gemmatimonadales bacterium]|nr:hypothetical protein [Gemmatimonadales bacterium]
MDSLDRDYPHLLLAERESPCLSLYQPTHRAFPERQQDPIRFRNLVKDLEQSLLQRYPERDVAALLAPFRRLADDEGFWNHPGEGLAVLGANDFFRVYRLQRPVAALAVVADSFHTKPMMRIVQSADRYQVLGIDRQRARLFEGNRDGLEEVVMAAEVPRTIDDALDRDIERERSTRTHGRANSASTTRQGTDVRQDSIDADTDAFFRSVDRSVAEHHSRPSGLPLILAALPDHQARFRRLSSNPALTPEGIDRNPESIGIEQLREETWKLVQPRYLERLSGLIDAYGVAYAKGQATDQLPDAARAAVEGRIACLLLEADRQQAGRLVPETGSIVPGDLDNPHLDDLFDDIGEHVLRNRGEVIIVPAESMPTGTGLAATYRF